MCGVVGELRLDGSPAPSLDKELALLAHRGPDGSGAWSEGPLSLGHRRLSIIDLSAAAAQPFHSPCGRWHLSYNGEIYNHVELRRELESAGESFRTHCDTEVLLKVLAREGWEGLKRCNGMFAFALWDSHERVLLLGRDRFGVKPLFIHTTPAALRFASEMKAVLPEGESATADRPFLYQFLDRREGEAVRRTVLQGVERLPPGHCLRVRGGKMESWRWYSLVTDPTVSHMSPEGRTARFRELMVDAVRLRLRSDVPVGVCLSGGVDSSVVTGIISKILGTPVQTFSSRHEEQGYAEGRFIDDVNAFCQATPHTLTPRAEDLPRVLDSLVRAHDKPVRMPGTYSQWHVMQCAKGHVTVLLDGQGADEILGGYRYYYPSAQASWLRRVVGGDLGALRKLMACRRGLSEHVGTTYTRAALSAFLRGRRSGGEDRWQDRVCRDDFIAEGRSLDLPQPPAPFDDPLQDHLHASFFSENLPMLLDYEDRISMAFSLEARVPFLDWRVVEFCFSLPNDDKIDGYENKAILRQAFADVIPPSVRHRRDKLGFPTPTEHWFRGPLSGYVRDILDSSDLSTQGYFDRGKVMALFEEHCSGKANHERLIWRVLSVTRWASLVLHPKGGAG
ncbi:MAG: asparagine synthase (glutamine-hydrolyzing) [Planctomycetota bacterium]